MLSEPKLKASPLAQSERIGIIDSLRGIALCGILLMNIPDFGLPHAAAFDPSVYNEFGTINYKVSYLIDLFPEGTFRGMFSILFGAGMLIFLDRLERRTEGMKAAELYMRRQLWLMVFGLFNAFVLLWFWDILFPYGVCGIILFPFRRLAPKFLLMSAIICLVLGTMRETIDLHLMKKIVREGERIERIDTLKTELNDRQRGKLEKMVEFRSENLHENKLKRAEKELAATRSDYGSIYAAHREMSFENHTSFFYKYGIWDILMCMFLGMAFFKLGILQGKKSTTIYIWMAVLGLGIGLLISYFRLETFQAARYNQFERIKLINFDGYEVSRAFRSIGVFGLIMLVYKWGKLEWLFRLFQPVGQMAFTNYLMQTIFCSFFFYGIGLGYFGKLQRFEIYYVVMAVWVIQIISSFLWLRYFRFGPFEWLWRSLTYWQMQPFWKGKKV